MKIKSFAKINLALDVLKKSGKYHQIQTVFQQIGLFDKFIFQKTSSKKITLHCADPKLPLGSKNTIIKAISLLKKVASTNKSIQKNITGLYIHLKKNIPISAGLGGGSSNAAATLIAVNKLWNLHLSKKILQALAAKIGMDVPFFLEGGTALGTHYGEKITALPPLPKLHLILMIPRPASSQAVSSHKTKTMYQLLNPKKIGRKIADTKALIAALKNKKYSHITKYFHNDFETVYESQQTIAGNTTARPGKMTNRPAVKYKMAIQITKIKNLKQKLLRSGATIVYITGAGPTLYALYKNKKIQQQAYKNIKKDGMFVWKS